MQHQILVDELDLYLAGNASQAFHDHLVACAQCSREVAAMGDLTGLFREAFRGALRATEDGREPEIQPQLGFYNRVAGSIIEKRRSEVWGLFSPGVTFFRRVAFASLLLLAGLGSFLVTREASAGRTDAVSVMAQHDVSEAHPESADRELLLVTLANYHE